MLKLLRRNDDISAIRRMLRVFYTERPSEYGLDTSRESAINAYGQLVQQAAEGRQLLLDFGCGNWRSPLELSRRGFIVIGLDVFSPRDLDSFSNQLKGPCEARLVTYDGATPLPFSDDSFDMVSSLCVFEHLTDVGSVLAEFSRVLKRSGRIIIHCPNWSGPNNCIRAILKSLSGETRYFHYEGIAEALWGLGISLLLPLYIKISPKARLVYILPRISNGAIDFEKADDDAVHLCVPTSFKKWFTKNGFRIVAYNRNCGSSMPVRVFNRFFPWYATTNLIIAEKL